MERTCAACGAAYTAKRPNSRYCSATCRQRAHRNPGVGNDAPAPDGAQPGAVTGSLRARLHDLDVEALPQAEVALALAARIDSPRETGAAVAALAKQLGVVLAELERLGRRAADPLDELRARRDAKRAG